MSESARRLISSYISRVLHSGHFIWFQILLSKSFFTHFAKHSQQTEGLWRQAREIHAGGMIVGEKSSVHIMQLVGGGSKMLMNLGAVSGFLDIWIPSVMGFAGIGGGILSSKLLKHAVSSLEAIANFRQLTRILLQHRSFRKRPGCPHMLFEFRHLLGKACPRMDPVLGRVRLWAVFDLSC